MEDEGKPQIVSKLKRQDVIYFEGGNLYTVLDVDGHGDFTTLRLADVNTNLEFDMVVYSNHLCMVLK